MFGPYALHITGRRYDDFHKTVDVLSQVILQNVKTPSSEAQAKE